MTIDLQKISDKLLGLLADAENTEDIKYISQKDWSKEIHNIRVEKKLYVCPDSICENKCFLDAFSFCTVKSENECAFLFCCCKDEVTESDFDDKISSICNMFGGQFDKVLFTVSSDEIFLKLSVFAIGCSDTYDLRDKYKDICSHKCKLC